MSSNARTRPNAPAPRKPRWFAGVLFVTVALIVGIVAIALFQQLRTGTPGSGAGQDATALPATRTNTHVLDNVGPDAPTLVEFLDLECEACGALHPIVKEVRAHYKGKINYAIRYFPLSGHFNAMNSALATEAAAQQGKVAEMSDMLLETQATWGEQRVSQAPLFRTYAEKLGLDMAAYDAAVADPATKARIEQDYNDGLALGVQSTPTFILDGKVLELQKLSDLTDPIDQAIAAGPKR